MKMGKVKRPSGLNLPAAQFSQNMNPYYIIAINVSLVFFEDNYSSVKVKRLGFYNNKLLTQTYIILWTVNAGFKLSWGRGCYMFIRVGRPGSLGGWKSHKRKGGPPESCTINGEFWGHFKTENYFQSNTLLLKGWKFGRWFSGGIYPHPGPRPVPMSSFFLSNED